MDWGGWGSACVKAVPRDSNDGVASSPISLPLSFFHLLFLALQRCSRRRHDQWINTCPTTVPASRPQAPPTPHSMPLMIAQANRPMGSTTLPCSPINNLPILVGASRLVDRLDLTITLLHSSGQMPSSDMYRLHTINMMPNAPQQYPQAYPSAPHGMPMSASPVPGESPQMYGEPLSPPISGGSDSGADAIYNSRSGTGSPSSSRGNSLVNHHHHRNPIRYNPTPSPSGSSGRRRGRSESDEDMGVSLAESIAHTRKEATRRQRIEAEQRRRDDLRDGYARLKDVLPVSNQKNSKVSLLERG